MSDGSVLEATAPVPMSPGSVVSAEFDGLGTVDVYS